MRKTAPAALALVTAIGAAAFAGQVPQITNGQVTEVPAGSLRQTFDTLLAQHADAAWIGYAVPAVPGERTMCCADGRQGCCQGCGLETGTAGTARPHSPGPISLEAGEGQLLVLFRVAARQVNRVRVFSGDCPLDAGGRAVTWLTAVRPPDSVALLERLVAGRDEPVLDGAIAAIALHADGAADASLDRLLTPGQPEGLRRKVPFWLGQARGARGLAALGRLVRDDASRAVRKAAVFGISQSREPRAVDVLIDNARANPDPATRGEAIFWLGQKAGNRVADALAERVEQDPDIDVQKRAVFALSQLPPDQGVPLLIQVARTHSSPAVKKQAIFWLGQSKDPRAVDFFADVLLR